MTNEEAIKFGNLIITMAKFDSNKFNKHTEEFTELAVKAIENQKSLQAELEDIKAEIQDLDLGFVDEEYKAGIAYGIMKFNQILDKHIDSLKGDAE